MDEIQADIPDVLKDMARLTEDLQNAESCETPTDLIDNLETAISNLNIAKAELTRMVKKAKRIK